MTIEKHMNHAETAAKRQLRHEQGVVPDRSTLPGPTLITVPGEWFPVLGTAERPGNGKRFDPIAVSEWVEKVLYVNEVVGGLMPWSRRGVHEDRFLLKRTAEGVFGYVQLDGQHFVYRPSLIEEFVFPRYYRPHLVSLSLKELADQFEGDMLYNPTWDARKYHMVVVTDEGKKEWFTRTPWTITQTKHRPENPFTAALMLMHNFSQPLEDIREAVRAGRLTSKHMPPYLQIDEKNRLKVFNPSSGKWAITATVRTVVIGRQPLTTLYRKIDDFPAFDAKEYMDIRDDLYSLRVMGQERKGWTDMEVSYAQSVFSLIDRWKALFLPKA